MCRVTPVVDESPEAMRAYEAEHARLQREMQPELERALKEGGPLPSRGGSDPRTPLSGPLQQVPNHTHRVPVPAVLDLDYGAGYTYRVRFDLDKDGEYGLRTLQVSAGNDKANITGKTLRSIRISELVAHVFEYLRGASMDYQTWGQLTPQDIHGDEAEVRKERGKEFLRSLGFKENPLSLDSKLAEIDRLRARDLGPTDAYTSGLVSELYRFAEQNGRSPADFIAWKIDISKSTANRWIRAARERGDLEPSRRAPRSITIEREQATDGDH